MRTLWNSEKRKTAAIKNYDWPPSLLQSHAYTYTYTDNNTNNLFQICSKIFPSEPGYKRHVRAHQNRLRKNIPCGICNMVFGHRSELEEHHRENHLDQKYFRCQVSLLVFSRYIYSMVSWSVIWAEILIEFERLFNTCIVFSSLAMVLWCYMMICILGSAFVQVANEDCNQIFTIVWFSFLLHTRCVLPNFHGMTIWRNTWGCTLVCLRGPVARSRIHVIHVVHVRTFRYFMMLIHFLYMYTI